MIHCVKDLIIFLVSYPIISIILILYVVYSSSLNGFPYFNSNLHPSFFRYQETIEVLNW